MSANLLGLLRLCPKARGYYGTPSNGGPQYGDGGGDQYGYGPTPPGAPPPLLLAPKITAGSDPQMPGCPKGGVPRVVSQLREAAEAEAIAYS